MKEYLKGLQHIGIPTRDIDKTIEFYESIGFVNIYRKKDDVDDVVFLRLGDMTIESYTGEAIAKTGAVDHIAIDVTDVEKVFELAKKGGYKLIDEEIHFINFFDKGVRYFMIEGPNAERVEFNQML